MALYISLRSVKDHTDRLVDGEMSTGGMGMDFASWSKFLHYENLPARFKSKPMQANFLIKSELINLIDNLDSATGQPPFMCSNLNEVDNFINWRKVLFILKDSRVCLSVARKM